MVYQVDYRYYCRPFRQPLYTHHGAWTNREGVILRLKNAEGSIGWGEIAPLPSFGSETLAEALAWCRSLSGGGMAEEIKAIPQNYSACRFGFEAAWEMMTTPKLTLDAWHWFSNVPPNCRLLPTGQAALAGWGDRRMGRDSSKEGDSPRTFKWKIGVAPIESELAWFEELMRQLPTNGLLRLDANGGLTWDEANRWLEVCDRLSDSPNSAQVEFIEQPLSPSQFEDLLCLSQRYRTPIALDESVATLAQLQECYGRGWRGIFVVKAAIAGSPSQLREFCQKHQPKIVWSSVFETAIAQSYIFTRLVPSLPDQRMALGFGANHWFVDPHMNSPTFDANLWFEAQ